MDTEDTIGMFFIVGMSIAIGVVIGVVIMKNIPAKFDKDDLLKRGIIEYNQNSGELQYNEKYESK